MGLQLCGHQRRILPRENVALCHGFRRTLPRIFAVLLNGAVIFLEGTFSIVERRHRGDVDRAFCSHVIYKTHFVFEIVDLLDRLFLLQLPFDIAIDEGCAGEFIQNLVLLVSLVNVLAYGA